MAYRDDRVIRKEYKCGEGPNESVAYRDDRVIRKEYKCGEGVH